MDAVIAKGRDVGAVRVERVRDGTREEVVHDVTFGFVFRAFHPNAPLIKAGDV